MDGTKNSTVPDIDQELLNISRRLVSIKDDLNDGIYGEMPKTENDEKAEMPTPSLKSMAQRLDYIKGTLSTIEVHVDKIHQSGKKVGS